MQPIKLSEKFVQEAAREFVAKLSGLDVSANTSVTFSHKLAKKAEGTARPTIHFTEEAYSKMQALVRHFSSEIAWHGTVERDGLTFTVTDIFVYPQTVTDVTVETDQTKYEVWLNSLDDDTFNHLRLQGHSHVSMACDPSGTDLSNQKRLIDTLRKDNYEVFIIWNKRNEWTARIYDLAANVMYDENDIDVTYEPTKTDEFIEEAEKQLSKPVVTTTYPYSIGKSTGTAAVSGSASGTTSGKTYSGYYNRSAAYMDDDDDDVCYNSGYFDGYGKWHRWNSSL